MPRSEELFAPIRRDIELCYQTFGDPDDEPLLLVMGLGGPMTWWDEDFCEQLARDGFHVIRFDNRDVGRSSRGRGRVSRAMLVRAFGGAAGAAAVHPRRHGRGRRSCCSTTSASSRPTWPGCRWAA